MTALKPLEEKFAVATLTESNLSRAYASVFNCSNWKASTISVKANALYKRTDFQVRLVELRNIAAGPAIKELTTLVEDLTDIHNADVNELIQYRRNNCRHCWGKDFAYQWINENEFKQQYDKIQERASTTRRKYAKPTDEGGYGFHSQAKPNPECPRCGGEGFGSVWVADTRTLSKEARKLYAGVKIGKDGQIEVKMRDQDGAADKLMRHLGGYKPEVVANVVNNNTQINSTGPTQVNMNNYQVPTDPMEIAKHYEQLMGNK